MSRDARLHKVVRELAAPGGTKALLPFKPLEREEESNQNFEDSSLKIQSVGTSPRSLRDDAELDGRPPLISQRRNVSMQDVGRERARREAKEA